MSLLKMSNVEVYYGPVVAVKGISLEVKESQIVTILGANGAGKTTILKTISGVMDPQKGRIEFNGKQIDHNSPDKIVRLGLSHVPEGREVFPDLTVKENLLMGAFVRKDNDEVRRDLKIIYNYFPILKERESQFAGTMSGGQQQMLAIARALMARPKLLLLDEPSLGLSPLLVKEIYSILKRINHETGTAFLLVEQNAMRALSLASYGYILETGHFVIEGVCSELITNKDVKEFYLGIKEDTAHDIIRYKRQKVWR